MFDISIALCVNVLSIRYSIYYARSKLQIDVMKKVRDRSKSGHPDEKDERIDVENGLIMITTASVP